MASAGMDTPSLSLLYMHAKQVEEIKGHMQRQYPGVVAMLEKAGVDPVEFLDFIRVWGMT